MVHRLMHCRLHRALAALGTLAALGCGEDLSPPTAHEPELAVASSPALVFRQISAGGRHTCGLTSDNRAYCWGYNVYGQLGDGTTTRRLRPVPVGGGLRFNQVSAGGAYTCGVTTGDRAYCWGQNSIGSLGDGTRTHRRMPVPVAGGRLFRQISAGSSHTTCALTPAEEAFCWGGNSFGNIGDGTKNERVTPVRVVGGHRFRQVSAGLSHTCGLTTSDRALCWGSNDYGQLGDGSEYNTGYLVPFPVAGDRRFRQVITGSFHSCAVTTGNKAFCWGSGDNGRIGDGKPYQRREPRLVAGGLSFRRVSGFGAHTCGETLEDRAYCWGYNYDGQMGDGTTTERPTPVAVTGGQRFRQVSAGQGQTCGVNIAGAGYCWGHNFFGEVGDGTTTHRTTPTAIAGPS